MRISKDPKNRLYRESRGNRLRSSSSPATCSPLKLPPNPARDSEFVPPCRRSGPPSVPTARGFRPASVSLAAARSLTADCTAALSYGNCSTSPSFLSANLQSKCGNSHQELI
ncbi:tetratricopeptide repeat protein [Striga asiatica]|uniref:Tetratricopeptide repeat protein n=1 Tax=Striga asiatica TaxID=4170 RepID=A0A5A7RKI9_STRAF|nr:tetratricopeptide repeat protein [Striga asiatica]